MFGTGNKKKRVAAVATTALLAAGAAFGANLATASAATSGISQQSLELTKSNGWITAKSVIVADTATPVDGYKVCVRDANGANFDLDTEPATTLTTTPTIYKEWKEFGAGTYSFSTCVQTKDRGWQKVGNSKSITVGATYTEDWRDDFDALDSTKWGVYNGTSKASTVSSWKPKNAFAEDGKLVLRTQREADGTWTSAGLSSARSAYFTGGKWVVRAKMADASGVGFAGLLYPKGGGWPPEVDFFEGQMATNKIVGTYHYDTDNKTIANKLEGIDLTQWHTYGVELAPGKLTYTLDGNVWAVQETSEAPDVPMWLGLQTNAKPTTKWGVGVSEATPSVNDLQIDWAAHYSVK